MTSQYRSLALFTQGLASRRFGKGLPGTRRAIEHLGYVQIDTLSVVERAHHHVLWSRVPEYDPSHLNLLIQKKHIFEYWYHAASYLPMRDYRYALPHMASIRNNENRYYTNVNKPLMNEILARIDAEGALRLRDFGKKSEGIQGNDRLIGDTKKAKSWSWGPWRRAFDKLFVQGDLMVCERNGMEKVYNLTERCLPEGIDLSTPTLSEYATYLFETTLRAHAIFTWKQLLHLKTGELRNLMRGVIEEHIDTGVIRKVSIKGISAYVGIDTLEQAPEINRTLKVLSPFDNVLIHRDRLSALFGFDYKIECYVPASKRVFGYFCLPILYGDKFVGRIDCKAHRDQQNFEVISLHLEEGEIDDEQFFSALNNELQRLAEFNQCPILDMNFKAT